MNEWTMEPSSSKAHQLFFRVFVLLKPKNKSMYSLRYKSKDFEAPLDTLVMQSQETNW